MKLAVPDMISNSYFPAEAAVELGFFKAEGLDVELELIFPVDKAYAALRDGAVDFVGGSAHSALAAFPGFRGVKLICAQAQGMYWFLVMHADLRARRGDVSVVKGRSIGAAPWVDKGLRGLLVEAGIDLERDRVKIAPVPGALDAGVNFGVTAAKALEARKIDGFWANGMGAEVAIRRGVGTVVLDVRRGDGPKPCFNYTAATIAATDALIARAPDTAAAAVRAIVKTQSRAQSGRDARRRCRQQAISAVRGRADHGSHFPRPALLRRHAVARVRRRHDANSRGGRAFSPATSLTSRWWRRNLRRCGTIKKPRNSWKEPQWP